MMRERNLSVCTKYTALSSQPDVVGGGDVGVGDVSVAMANVAVWGEEVGIKGGMKTREDVKEKCVGLEEK